MKLIPESSMTSGQMAQLVGICAQALADARVTKSTAQALIEKAGDSKSLVQRALVGELYDPDSIQRLDGYEVQRLRNFFPGGMSFRIPPGKTLDILLQTMRGGEFSVVSKAHYYRDVQVVPYTTAGHDVFVPDTSSWILPGCEGKSADEQLELLDRFLDATPLANQFRACLGTAEEYVLVLNQWYYMTGERPLQGKILRAANSVINQGSQISRGTVLHVGRHFIDAALELGTEYIDNRSPEYLAIPLIRSKGWTG